ncbi:MAG: FHA domain-containing protein [Xanthomonadales bacterium]|nr:FHA domain-containing protein [Xanthomonadales bacterium]
MIVSIPAWSQSAAATDSMPPWTVLALKLVSATHVQPTTGIVIAAPDMVLVAIDFAREGDEIMVLDGGTDIVRHGRPATIVHTLPADKLAILKVQGLNRPAASLSALSESELKSLNLVAFPPAEMIAQGSAPVRAAVQTLPAITTSHPTLESFANVSGALTDACGNLVAFNMSVGVQSMQPTGSPRLAWPDALQRAAKLTGTPLRTAECSATDTKITEEPPAEQPEPAAEPTPEPIDEPASPVEKSPLDQPDEPDLAITEQVDPQLEAEAEAEQEQAEADGELEIEQLIVAPEVENPALEPAIDDAAKVASPRQASRTTLIFAGLIALLLLAWFIRRWRKNSRTTGSAALSATSQTEPGTVRFAADEQPAPVVMLLVSGQQADGAAFTRRLPVNGPDWYAVLGREGTDVNLASSTVSRRHARVQFHQGRITVSDLESTNGSRLNGVPCLPGEVFFVQSGDLLQLGDVTVNLQLTAGND